ncbi:hypothetical protein MLD38_039386 [Melastoma candidum]|uniref:Uncharacterized protein n=1 Tax=Melastoma candidum TaxID=119954 RepID=A0ACB9L491_9MYRT|nr:hypothetical protein MLD38_039386 [Melastoma candidum]
MALIRPTVLPRAHRPRPRRFKSGALPCSRIENSRLIRVCCGRCDAPCCSEISMKMQLVHDERTLSYLSWCFQNALSKCPKTQQVGVKSLAEASTMQNYSICILCLAFDDFLPLRVCVYAAKAFTDHIRNRWSPTSSNFKPILEAEKCEIIDLILAEISNAPWRVESQLPEALKIIGLQLDPSEILPESSSEPLTQLRGFGVIPKMTAILRGFV